MRRLAAALAGTLACSFASGPAMAWGSGGHRAIGAIAAQLIEGSSAQQHVAALLQPGESLETISVWADCIKLTAPAGCGAQTPEMAAFAAANPGHASYHYADVPFQLTHYHDHDLGTHADDVVQVLKQAIAVLRGDSSDNPHQFTPRQALLMVAHLTGDLHQPLHVGGAYVARSGGFALPEKRSQLRDGDVSETRGGQDLLLDQSVPGEAKTANHGLHAYWDYVLVDETFRRAGAGSGPAAPQKFARLALASTPAPEANTGDAALWPCQWADEALAAAKPAFNGVVAGAMELQKDDKDVLRKAWPVALPQGYGAVGADSVRRQLVRAGYHLAALLQAIWP